MLVFLTQFFISCSDKAGNNESHTNLSTTVDSLRQELNTVKDRQDIAALAYGFSDAVMRADSASFSKIWDDDAVWTIKAPMFSSLVSKKEIMKVFLPRMKSLDYFINYPTNYTISITGNQASALFYILEAGQFKEGKKGYYNYAVYSDSLVKKNGKWLFTKREYNYIYLDHSAMKGDPIASPFSVLEN